MIALQDEHRDKTSEGTGRTRRKIPLLHAAFLPLAVTAGCGIETVGGCVCVLMKGRVGPQAQVF